MAMKINRVILTNFRGISAFEFDFQEKCTVFYGINGVGKTTILRAIDLLYSSIINKIVRNRFKQGIKIELADIKYGKPFCEVTCDFSIDGIDESIAYSRKMFRKENKRIHNTEKLSRISEIFREKYIESNQGMPIFVNYGVNRTVMEIPLRIRNTHIFDKESAFEKAIESKIDFRTFFEWFRYQEDLENQIKVRENREYVDVSLRSVKEAVYAMLDGVSNLRIERNPLAMKVDKEGISFRVDQLSDGEKCTLALFGDLARRLALANPDIANPLQGNGVVLIDEIELHMHPLWQRKILPILKKCFPNIQFIVTTHSPQVLGELDDSYNIIGMERVGDTISYKLIPSLIGWDSNYILKCFMGTDNLNPSTQELIEKMYDLISENNYDESEKLVKILEELTDTAHEDAVKARMLIRRGRKRTNEENH